MEYFSKSFSFSRNKQFIQERWRPIVRDVALELFHGSEVLTAERAACDDNFVLVVHECRKVMILNFGLRARSSSDFLMPLSWPCQSVYGTKMATSA
jgi:hypothetical protein